MKKHSFATADLGSISSGTMRPEDLMSTFCEELRWLGHRSSELTRIEKRVNSTRSEKYYESEESSFDLDSLFDMLEEHAPAWAYFGAHPGDGSDYGFWVSEGIQDDFDGLTVGDLSEIPASYRGEVLHVNDHGNMTLYVKTARKLIEIWAVV